MKVVFMGTPPFSVPILEALSQKYQVVLVVTQPDKPVGRKRVLTPPPVKVFAQENNLPVVQPEKVKEITQLVKDLAPDLIVTAAYGQFIPEAILKVPRHRAINVHASLLPKYRGGSPIQHALINGDKVTGITIMYMEKAMDSGDILAQRELFVDDADTSGTLFAKLSILGRDLLMETIPLLIEGKIKPVPQNPSEVSFAYNLTPSDEELDLTKGARDVYNRYRALMPEPVPFLVLKEQKIKIHKMRISSLTPKNQYGEITHVGKDYFTISCGNNSAIDILELQLPGGKVITARDFINGKLKNFR
ncbi:MAG: methionyl-tRNA formyltransferase [Bacilli bacterium]|jgi:methionyl-tRNA formyltransferase|nr:methionyl-tRNA formyltransferase [Bacilli bacterium]HHU24634.1 methionyl-tRNA formyltransferase [Acholeplasmataceae bacterium]